jgi:hypothetical protein
MEGYNVHEIKFNTQSNSSISSMALGKNGMIYLGLTSYNRVLLELDPTTDEIKDLGDIFPKQENNFPVMNKIHNSLAVDEDGRIYIGQGLKISWCTWPYEFNLVKYAGAHLFSYDPSKDNFEDFGVQVPLNAIHGITLDSKNRRIYGYTIPDNHFFMHDLKTHTVKDYGRISQYCSHNLIIDKKGNVYGAWKKDLPFVNEKLEGRFFVKGVYLLKYDFEKDELIRTKNLIVYGQEDDILTNIGVDSWVCTSRGCVFGGKTTGGMIFKLNADDSIENIIKPTSTPRITCMMQHSDGLIYGTAGFPHMHLFVMNPDTFRIKDLGAVYEEDDACYFHGMVLTDDGTIYVGELGDSDLRLFKLIKKPGDFHYF